MKTIAIAFAAGLLFGFGLIVSGMTDPNKVLNFLDVAGHWDPSLAFVMGAALCITIPGFVIAKKRTTSFTGVALQIPNKTDLDPRLLGGAALFGIGWGLVGLCPGPAVVAVGTGATMVLVFFGSLLAGMFAFSVLPSK